MIKIKYTTYNKIEKIKLFERLFAWKDAAKNTSFNEWWLMNFWQFRQRIIFATSSIQTHETLALKALTYWRLFGKYWRWNYTTPPSKCSLTPRNSKSLYKFIFLDSLLGKSCVLRKTSTNKERKLAHWFV